MQPVDLEATLGHKHLALFSLAQQLVPSLSSQQEGSIPVLWLRIIYNCQTRYCPENCAAYSYEPAIIT